MFGLFKRKTPEEKQFRKIDKILDKNLIKARKKGKGGNLKKVIEEYNLKEEITNLSENLGYNEEISCYNERTVATIISILERQEFIKENEDYQERIKKYRNYFASYIERNILFLNQALTLGKFYFDNTREEVNSKRKDKENRSGGYIVEKNKFYYDELLDLLKDKKLDPSILENMFYGMVKKSGHINNGHYMLVLDKLLTHNNLRRGVLIEFLKSQNSKKKEDGYIDYVTFGNDIDFNEIKRIILKKKILKHHELLGLAKLPYISLWEELIDNYYLSPLLLKDFLVHIFEENKSGRSKYVIGKFLISKVLTRPNISFEIKFMIDEYLKGVDFSKMEGEDEEEDKKPKVERDKNGNIKFNQYKRKYN